MLRQNYLKVFENANGEIVIASTSGDPEDFQTLDVDTIAISKDDIETLASALLEIAKNITKKDFAEGAKLNG